MKYITGKASKYISALLLILIILSGVQIWRVNHSYNLRAFKAEIQVYKAGTEINLPNEMYYIDSADLTGYSIRVVNTEIKCMENFLEEYNSSFEEIEPIFRAQGLDYREFGLIYLVNTEFKNVRWNENTNSIILLDNFLLVGSDYWENPATNSINLLSEVNPELRGNSAFAIQSDRTLSVEIPYLIPTKSANRISREYLLSHPPKLLIALYPQEIYLELPPPIT